MLRLAGDTLQVAVGEVGGGLAGEPGGLAEHLPQPRVAGAHQQGGGLMGLHGLPPHAQPVQYLPEVPVGEEIQGADQSLAAGGDRAGYIEYGRAADAVLGEQHLTAVFRHGPAAPEDGDAALGLDAFQRPGIGGVGLQLHQGGVQGGAVVPQRFGQAIAVHDAAHLAAGAAAGGENELSGGKSVRLRPDGEDLRCPLHGGDHLTGAHLDAGVLQPVAQHVQHAAGHVAHRVDPAAVLIDRQQPQGGEILQRGAHIEGAQRISAEAAVLAVVAGGGGVVVGQVAPAVAGGQQLAAHPALPLQQEDAVAVFRGGQRGHHAPGATADDDHIRHFAPPSFRRVR